MRRDRGQVVAGAAAGLSFGRLLSCVRAGLDYWEHLVWEVVDDWPALVPRLPAREPWYFTKHATRMYDEVEFAPGDIFVFGCESAGLPRAMWQSTPERALRIPIRAEARSLNLSNSVAIALFEARRQFSTREKA